MTEKGIRDCGAPFLDARAWQKRQLALFFFFLTAEISKCTHTLRCSLQAGGRRRGPARWGRRPPGWWGWRPAGPPIPVAGKFLASLEVSGFSQILLSSCPSHLGHPWVLRQWRNAKRMVSKRTEWLHVGEAGGNHLERTHSRFKAYPIVCYLLGNLLHLRDGNAHDPKNNTSSVNYPPIYISDGTAHVPKYTTSCQIYQWKFLCIDSCSYTKFWHINPQAVILLHVLKAATSRTGVWHLWSMVWRHSQSTTYHILNYVSTYKEKRTAPIPRNTTSCANYQFTNWKVLLRIQSIPHQLSLNQAISWSKGTVEKKKRSRSKAYHIAGYLSTEGMCFSLSPLRVFAQQHCARHDRSTSWYQSVVRHRGLPAESLDGTW